ncbi:hypothetical protein [Parahaliea aestuarii]|uniref:Uncharacterized protein n=1 Tax=Parahaliea aestuarii TaxID=1852021 RepID=A0A5C9A326_9GAMM|nr:hypothetical protein [Parahaliea aestuarii]TXS95116.1 hypothetical protein FVW59_04255 [Parahaliea aestuarii]
MEANKLVELRTDTLAVQGVLVRADGDHAWIAEAVISQGGKPTRDLLIKTLVRVKNSAVRAAAEIQRTDLLYDYAAITALPDVGNNLSAWVGGEELKGVVVSHEPLAIKDGSGRNWGLADPDVLDTLIDRGRARSLIAAALKPQAPVTIRRPQAKPAPAAKAAALPRFVVEYVAGNEPVKLEVEAEGPAEAREKADELCSLRYPDASFLGLRESA